MFTWGYVLGVATPYLKMVAVLIVGHILIRYLIKILKRALGKTKFDNSLVGFISKALNISLHALLIISALNIIGVQTSGILATLSAVAIAVSVALKDSLSNVAGGMLMLIVPRFQTGDYIEAGANQGTVVGVDLLHTKLLTSDNKQVIIPNGTLMSGSIINYTREEKRRVDIPFDVPSSADVETVKQIILSTISSNAKVVTDPESPIVRIQKCKGATVEIISQSWCKTEDYQTVYYDLIEQVRKTLDENGIKI